MSSLRRHTRPLCPFGTNFNNSLCFLKRKFTVSLNPNARVETQRIILLMITESQQRQERFAGLAAILVKIYFKFTDSCCGIIYSPHRVYEALDKIKSGALLGLSKHEIVNSPNSSEHKIRIVELSVVVSSSWTEPARTKFQTCIFTFG